MGSFLRNSTPELLDALALGGAQLWRADLFEITPLNQSPLYWCTWDSDLTVAAQLYTSKKPWIERSDWEVANTMQVPTMTLTLHDLDEAFASGPNIKLALHNGFFDGASVLFSRAYMEAPGVTTVLGVLELFAGVVGGIDIVGTTATIQVKGKNNLLDQNLPRNIYQTGCNHAFCDAGCTLNRANFTSSFVVGANPTNSFLPWSAPPPNSGEYKFGTVTMTSGACAGQIRGIIYADNVGVSAVYPFYGFPEPGDTFLCFLGCDKTFNSGSGQSCSDYSNQQHFRGFPFIPQPNSAYAIPFALLISLPILCASILGAIHV